MGVSEAPVLLCWPVAGEEDEGAVLEPDEAPLPDDDEVALYDAPLLAPALCMGTTPLTR
jgi:hypothetical protein